MPSPHKKSFAAEQLAMRQKNKVSPDKDQDWFCEGTWQPVFSQSGLPQPVRSNEVAQ